MTDTPVDKYRQPVLGDENALKLALFGINLRGGVTLSDVEGKIEATWEENLRLATLRRPHRARRDRAGRALARLRRSREPRPALVRDVHLGHGPARPHRAHPGLRDLPRAARPPGARREDGRHRRPRLRRALRPEHRRRLVRRRARDVRPRPARARRALRGRRRVGAVLKQLWTVDGERDFHGRYFDVPAGVLEPKPLQKPYPTIMNAGTSPAGRAFAAKHSDVIFAGLTNAETAADADRRDQGSSRASEHGREIRVFGRGHIVCRDTAGRGRGRLRLRPPPGRRLRGRRERHRHQQARTRRAPTGRLDERRLLEGMIAGFWGIPMVGSPDQVAQKMLDLHAAGADGIAISFVNFDEGLDADGARRSCRGSWRPACAHRCAEVRGQTEFACSRCASAISTRDCSDGRRSSSA